MSKIVQLVMIPLLLIGGLFFYVGNVHAQVSHVSINEQQFVLGGYPKFRLNIVSQHESIDKVQFVVRQASGEERLMVKPINNFLLLVSGVEDVLDPDATLVVREYRVNKWRDVKAFPLFTGQKLSPDLAAKASKAHLKVKKPEASAAMSTTAMDQNKPAAQLKTTPLASQADLIDETCHLEYTSEMTLWRISTLYGKKWGISTYGAIVSIFEANSSAFIDGEINKLRADVPLACPSAALRANYADNARAKKAFDAI